MPIQEFLLSFEKMKETVEWAFNLGRGMCEEYYVLNFNYMLFLDYAYCTQSGWNEPLTICQGQEEGNPTPPTPAEETVPFIMTLPPEGCLAISPNMPTIWIHCPWDALTCWS